MEEKAALEHKQRECISPTRQHCANGSRRGIGCPFTMYADWLGPNGPICVRIGKGKAGSHADNCEPVADKKNVPIPNTKKRTPTTQLHGPSAWKAYKPIPISAPPGDQCSS